MSKNDKKPGQPETPIQNARPPVPDASKKYFFLFWGLIVLAAAAAWILAILLPGVSESIIERWLMAALAAALAVLRFIYK